MPSQTVMPIPPRPSWMGSSREPSPPPKKAKPPAPGLPREQPVPEDVRQRRALQRAGNTSAGVLASAAIHVAILLVLNLWYFATRPAPSGYVINCAIETQDDGAATEENAVVQAPLPDEPAPKEDGPVEIQPGEGGNELKVARLGGGGGAADGAGAGGGGVGFFGTKAQGDSFVFVVDRSGSMDGGRLTVAKQELNRAIGSLRPDQKFYVFFYNSGTDRMLSPASPDGLVFAIPEMRDQVRMWMRPILATGSTEPAESLLAALEMRPDVIFFLTDGKIPDDTDEVLRREQLPRDGDSHDGAGRSDGRSDPPTNRRRPRRDVPARRGD